MSNKIRVISLNEGKRILRIFVFWAAMQSPWRLRPWSFKPQIAIILHLFNELQGPMAESLGVPREDGLYA